MFSTHVSLGTSYLDVCSPARSKHEALQLRFEAQREQLRRARRDNMQLLAQSSARSDSFLKLNLTLRFKVWGNFDLQFGCFCDFLI